MNTYFLHILSYSLEPVHEMFMNIKDAMEEHVIAAEKEYGIELEHKLMFGANAPSTFGEAIYVFRSNFSVAELNTLMRDKERDAEFYLISLKEPDMIVHNMKSPSLQEAVQIFFNTTAKNLEKMLTDNEIMFVFAVSQLSERYMLRQMKKQKPRKP